MICTNGAVGSSQASPCTPRFPEDDLDLRRGTSKVLAVGPGLARGAIGKPQATAGIDRKAALSPSGLEPRP